jgi:hypothetical protein
MNLICCGLYFSSSFASFRGFFLFCFACLISFDKKVMMLSAPIPASRKVLQIAGLKVSDIDLWEVNEAFASVPLALCKELGVDLKRLNVNGGAMALGHPLGKPKAKEVRDCLTSSNKVEPEPSLLRLCCTNWNVARRVTASFRSAREEEQPTQSSSRDWTHQSSEEINISFCLRTLISQEAESMRELAKT